MYTQIRIKKDTSINNLPRNHYYQREIENLWPNAPLLRELGSPTALRSDLAATTLMDDAGATYLLPNGDYDFSISEELHSKGLQDGEVVYAEGQAVALKFPAEEDLVSFPAVINASVGVEDAYADVEQALVLFADLATRMNDELGVVPSDMTIDALAVDRTKNTAVLLPPFKVSPNVDARTALESLYLHAMNRAHTYQEQQVIQKAWNAALKQIEG